MFGHDYAVPGTYEVTIAVAGRQPVFGQVQGTTKAGGEPPHIVPSALGRAVLNDEIPKIHHYYPMVDVWQVCLMPDHMHLIVRINKPLPTGKHLGIIIGAFKGGVSRAWWKLSAAGAPTAAAHSTAAPPSPTAAPPSTAVRPVSTTVPVASAAGTPPPLFEPNYNDHILTTIRIAT